MGIHTIKRTMLKGNDFDTGELEFVAKIDHPDGSVLLPLAGELESAAVTPEAFDKYVLFGALLGNTISTADYDHFAYRVKNHVELWSDELSVTVPDELE